MRIALLSLALVILAAISPTARAEEALGLGIILGEPTGISFKNWIGDDRAIDGGIAWSFSGHESIHFHLDYLIHKEGHIRTDEVQGSFPFYYGLGGRLKLREENDGDNNNGKGSLLGVRIPLGLSHRISDAPMDFFIEIVPVLDVVPDTDFDLNAAIGARYYF